MRNRAKISISDLQANIQDFQNGVADFSKEKYDKLHKQLLDIKDDAELILLESEDRYQDRLKRRPALNKKIKEENRLGPQKEIEAYIGSNPKEFLETMKKKGAQFDEHGNMIFGKLKRQDQISNVVPVQFTPRPFVTSDDYASVHERMEFIGKEMISQLTQVLETANRNAKTIFESYGRPSELFNKLGLSIKDVDYAFFAKERSKERVKHEDATVVDKIPDAEPTFKKIGSLMKYLLDNNVPFRANNIIKDKNDRYQFYLYEHDITFLISDVVAPNGFRDSTYVIKGMVSGLRNVSKEALKDYQGKKIVYSENRTRRVEGMFTDDPQNRPLIGDEKEDQVEETKTLITDKEDFIAIIKEHFTQKSLNIPSYSKFAREYNLKQGNTLLLNDTLIGNASLLGLGGKRSIEDIKKAIFESTRPELEMPEDSFFSNAFTKQTLVAIQGCDGFDPDKTLGSSNYASRVMELLRKACNEEFVDAVKNMSKKDKKAKLEEYTGIKDLPLFGLKLTSMLGGRVRSVNADYQRMLRKRFLMNIDGQTASEEYRLLQDDILGYEGTFEDEGLHPNTVKYEKKGKKKEDPKEGEDTDIDTQEKPEKKPRKSVKEVMGETSDALTYALKDPVTLESFPLFKVRSAKVIGETPKYRIVKAHNSLVELRLLKSANHDAKEFTVGKKIDVFASQKNLTDNRIKVHHEAEKGQHKVAEFSHLHPDALAQRFIPGETYEGIVNNVRGKYAYVSLTKNYSGRLLIREGEDFSIGETVKVIFDSMDVDENGKTIVRIYC